MKRDGFTLLELLVAMAIFALMSIMAYGGLGAMIDTKAHVERESEKLAELQLAFTMLGRDVQQAIGRPIRDGYGEPLPAMVWSQGMEPQIEWTRSGWRNPTGRLRSDLQRVRYQLTNKVLERLSWAVLDRAPNSEPFVRQMADGVESFTVEFLDEMGQWHGEWPMVAEDQLADGPPLDRLPLAIRFSVDINGWGRIQRLFLVGR